MGDDLDPAAARRALGGEEVLTRRIEAWVAEARIDEAARRRLREAWLARQAEEEATLPGVLTDIGERGARVVVLAGSRRLGGRIAGIGVDYVAVAADTGQLALVRLSAITVVRTEPGVPGVTGDRLVNAAVRLADMVGPIAAERPDVLVEHPLGEPVRGQLRSAGDGVLVLRTGDPPATLYVNSMTMSLLLLL